ncbi:mitochondrial ribosomal protein L37-domain-containing protein [Obelidium mucronatum]|nr:mitochondrial ribosomal protein L37-domain-containing protein [Obelidium mucronatum]
MSKVLKNINILAGKADPIIKPDAEYPAWLFSLLEQSQKPKTEWTPEEQLSVKYLRIQNRQRIKAVALAKK